MYLCITLLLVFEYLESLFSILCSVLTFVGSWMCGGGVLKVLVVMFYGCLYWEGFWGVCVGVGL